MVEYGLACLNCFRMACFNCMTMTWSHGHVLCRARTTDTSARRLPSRWHRVSLARSKTKAETGTATESGRTNGGPKKPDV